ncbi:MAG: hypothetical protein ICV74_00140 [Thermoleophilia bacterium]|nr:hypothetical protein [Thermoleophilia bacterium]
MKIELLAAPHRIDDLLRFLRTTGYVVREVDYGVVEVEEGKRHTSATGVSAVALAFRLRVWNAVNDADAQIVDVNGSLEP